MRRLPTQCVCCGAISPQSVGGRAAELPACAVWRPHNGRTHQLPAVAVMPGLCAAHGPDGGGRRASLARAGPRAAPDVSMRPLACTKDRIV